MDLGTLWVLLGPLALIFLIFGTPLVPLGHLRPLGLVDPLGPFGTLGPYFIFVNWILVTPGPYTLILLDPFWPFWTIGPRSAHMDPQFGRDWYTIRIAQPGPGLAYHKNC